MCFCFIVGFVPFRTMSEYFLLGNATYGPAAIFVPFVTEDGLPFPLNQPTEVKYFLAVVLSAILILGISVRSKIIKFLWISDNKKNPINYFFWLDQSKGIFSGLNILFTVMANVAPFPISNIIGYELCNWVDFLGVFYLIGSAAWSCNIALFREIKHHILA